MSAWAAVWSLREGKWKGGGEGVEGGGKGGPGEVVFVRANIFATFLRGAVTSWGEERPHAPCLLLFLSAGHRGRLARPTAFSPPVPHLVLVSGRLWGVY